LFWRLGQAPCRSGESRGTTARRSTFPAAGVPSGSAGLKLRPFPTQHGERPGHPGCLAGKYDGDLLAPEGELYPRSVEHWRAYMFKYMPIRSFFDRQSMLKNWIAAVIEPFAGEPLITGLRRLEVEGQTPDARQAVAVEIQTKQGDTDVCFADGDPARVRSIHGPEMRVAGEFAFCSTERQGLRQTVLVGGKLLETPTLRVAAAEPKYRATVTRVDCLQRRQTIDRAWPGRAPTEGWSQPSVIEIGLAAADDLTTYTAAKIESGRQQSLITLDRGADYYRSTIERFNPDGTVFCTLKPLVEYVSGNRQGWVAWDDAMTRFWRAEYLGNQTFRLAGDPADAGAFGRPPVLRLWEYGVGDTVRRSTSVCLRETGDGLFELEADVDVTLSLKTAGVEVLQDGKTWHALPGQRRGEWIACRIAWGRVAEEPLRLRLVP
jgi:hypothetical protein